MKTMGYAIGILSNNRIEYAKNDGVARICSNFAVLLYILAIGQAFLQTTVNSCL